MSWIHLLDPTTQRVVLLPSDHRPEGVTYRLQGKVPASLEYGPPAWVALEGLLGQPLHAEVDGRTAAATLSALEKALSEVAAGDPDSKGPHRYERARGTLEVLVGFARARPDGIWKCP